jgi:hypothetical protein
MGYMDVKNVLGQPYNRETSKYLHFGGVIDSKGIIVEVITEEQSTTHHCTKNNGKK